MVNHTFIEALSDVLMLPVEQVRKDIRHRAHMRVAAMLSPGLLRHPGELEFVEYSTFIFEGTMVYRNQPYYLHATFAWEEVRFGEVGLIDIPASLRLVHISIGEAPEMKNDEQNAY